MARPVFQYQGGARICVIDDIDLGWDSCTAFAMAMLIDAAKDGHPAPKGCFVRRKTVDRDSGKVDRKGGLSLTQVQAVAEANFQVPISLRTGAGSIPIARAIARVEKGRGFVLQGNNDGWGRPAVDHAVYVDRVRGPLGAPTHALVYDPQRQGGETWIPWARVVAFGSRLRVNGLGDFPRAGTLWAGFGPRRPTAAERAAPADPPDPVDPGVRLRFGAKRLAGPRRMKASPPPGRSVNVRDTPRSLARAHIVDTLDRGEVFIAWQRLENGERPGQGATGRWYGNRDGTDWVHASGLKRVPGAIPPGALEGVGDLDADPPEAPTDTGTDPSTSEVDDELDEVANGSLRDFQADPDATTDASDPFPDELEGDFKGGRELSEAEIDALPVSPN